MGKNRMGMTAAYALGLMERQADREGKQAEVEWLTNEDGSRPTVEEAIEWLETLDSNYDVVNDKQL